MVRTYEGGVENLAKRGIAMQSFQNPLSNDFYKTRIHKRTEDIRGSRVKIGTDSFFAIICVESEGMRRLDTDVWKFVAPHFL